MSGASDLYGASRTTGLGENVSIFISARGATERLTPNHQGAPQSGKLPKTGKWRLSNSPGLPITPNKQQLESSDKPKHSYELLLAITELLHTGELKNQGW